MLINKMKVAALLPLLACVTLCWGQSKKEISNILLHDKYVIRFQNRTVPRTEALQWLGELPGTPALTSPDYADWDGEAKFNVYRITEAETYLCRVPLFDNTLVSEAPDDRRMLSSSETDRILTRGLELLKNLTDRPLNIEFGYFSHVLRYQKYILQFPRNDWNDNNVVAKVEGGEQLPEGYYLLGLWNSDVRVTSQIAPYYDVPSADLEEEIMAPRTDDALYIQQVWQNGTICDLNGLPRVTTVKVRKKQR